MQRPADIPHEAGVFAIHHRASKQAYVNTARDLRQRSIIWAHHLKAHEKDPTHSVRVRNWPSFPSDQWEFWFSTTDTADNVQTNFREAGYTLINERVRKRQTYVVQGVDDTLLGHCRRLGIPWGAVYKRVERGETPEQAMGLVERRVLDAREYAISQMRMHILTNDGEGLLTYDEAVMLRPELGDVRRRVQKLMKRNPELQSVRLQDIPV